MTTPHGILLAKVGAFLMATFSSDQRTLAEVVPSAAVLEARHHATVSRAQAAERRCPDTPADLDHAVTLAFAVQSADLTEAVRSHLDIVAAHLSCAPRVTVRIVSKGDPHRLEAYRREVAERRAETIATRLRQLGLDEARLATAPSHDDLLGGSQNVLVIEAAGPPV